MDDRIMQQHLQEKHLYTSGAFDVGKGEKKGADHFPSGYKIWGHQ